MFDLSHILYMIISAIITTGLLIAFALCLKDEKQKKAVLKISALATVILHYSSLYVDYFTQGTASIDSTMILPVYPCNVAMWFLLAVAFIKNMRGIFFKYLSEATFYLGVTGGIIGIVFNENYASNPNLADWDILKGLLSHSTLLLGCIYLLTGKFIRIRVDNVLSVTFLLLFLLLDGGIVIGLHSLFGLNPPNCMYLLENPFPALTWFNTWLIGALAFFVCFIFTAVYEQIALKKEERWYFHLNEWKQRLKQRKTLNRQ